MSARGARFLGKAWLVLLLLSGFAASAHAGGARVQSLKITVLSTMLADGPTLGEWGFAALVEVDGHRLLFDTGAHTDVVLKNAQALDIDLSTVPEVVLSHSHSDHVGGLLTLRRSLSSKNREALARVHGAAGLFAPRTEGAMPVEANPMIALKPEFETAGGRFVVHDKPVQLYPGVWFTGPIPRPHPERNWSGDGKLRTPQGLIEDNLPEDSALIIDTEKGLVVLTGCGHAGVINTVEYARSTVRPVRGHALIGGLHLFNADDRTLRWTAAELGKVGVDYLVGAHCTGLETVYRFRTDLSLDRAHAVVGAVGARFELGKGIEPGYIAR